MLQNLHQ